MLDNYFIFQNSLGAIKIIIYGISAVNIGCFLSVLVWFFGFRKNPLLQFWKNSWGLVLILEKNKNNLVLISV
jgi:hypothetical protein